MFEKLRLNLPLEPMFILHHLQQNGFEGYIVGGAVRDVLRVALEQTTADLPQLLTAIDFDFATQATPEQIQDLFPEHFYENKFGTVGVAQEHLHEQMGFVDIAAPETNEQTVSFKAKTIDLTQATKIHESLLHSTANKKVDEHAQTTLLDTARPATQQNDIQQLKESQVYEITTFRSDEVYRDFRRPESVNWGTTIESDLDRRDFTINALALKIDESFLQSLDFTKQQLITIEPHHYTVIDLHSGIEDLQANIVRTVGEPERRFQEDALRPLRAVRFSVQLGMTIEPQTFAAIKTHAQLLSHISAERVRDEFLKMLSSDQPKRAIELLDETDLLSHILPELLTAKGVQQGGHHTTDVWVHSLDALQACPSQDPIVRLAVLLHDIAKPPTYRLVNGQPTFYNHEVIGARMAKNIAHRLRLSKKDTQRIFLLVRYHMFYYQPKNTDASIRRFMRKVGLSNIDDILDLREADRLGSGARKTSWRLEEMKQRMVEQLNQPFAITDMAIDGHDLIRELSLQPGPMIGKILKQLFEAVIEDPQRNTRETLLEMARTYL